jgi:anhydro-N-acetylmuramic acid kinase
MHGSGRLIIGAMSGTSADGVDVALVAVHEPGEPPRARLIGHRHRAFDANLKSLIQNARQSGRVELADLAKMGRELSLAYAQAILDLLDDLKISPVAVAALAAHGQTLFHAPPETIQWLDPALLAAQVGIDVVSDFRRADCAAGGQGAPLVPLADFVLFRDAERSRVILNIGGIANITHLPAGVTLGQVIAFDTGPGNCLSDWCCRRFDPAGPGWDQAGRLAADGNVIESLAGAVLNDAYFRRRPPKSTDGPAMIAPFERALVGLRDVPEPADLLTTACAIAARSIVAAIGEFLPGRCDELIASGGGTENQTIMAMLRDGLTGARVLRTDDLGVPGAAKEAIAFALLGAATLDRQSGNVPSATGAAHAVVLGSVTPRPEQ